MIHVDFVAGCNVEKAMNQLKEVASRGGVTTYGEFNGKTLYSTDTVDEAYVKVTGKTKAEHDKALQKWHDDYERELAEHQAKIPELTKHYQEKARGLILETEYEFWDKIVPIRLDDLYRGMELDQTLDICAIMRDESLEYEQRLRKAYKCFMNAGHSGMSAHLVASMLRKFSPNGEDIADAVMNFRFDKQ